MLNILEPEVLELGIAGRLFRFVELSGAALKTFVARHQEVGTKALLRLYREDLPGGFIDAWDIVDEEECRYIQWLLELGNTEADPVELEWVRENVTDSMRRQLVGHLEQLNNLVDRAGKVKRLLIVTGRITAGAPSSTLSAGATVSAPEPYGSDSPPDRS